jgi:hypothetical protein
LYCDEEAPGYTTESSHRGDVRRQWPTADRQTLLF